MSKGQMLANSKSGSLVQVYSDALVKTEPEHLHFSVPEENGLYPEHMLQHAGKHTPALGHRVTFS